MQGPTDINSARSIYLDLMKKNLTNWIYGQSEVSPWSPKKNPLKRAISEFLKARDLQIVRPRPMQTDTRITGEDRSPVAHTMIGFKRLNNIQFCVEDVIAKGVPGDLIETGVWRGGATIFMRAILRAYDVKDRTVWVADSFEGCPRPDGEKYPEDASDILYTSRELAITLETVRSNFECYDLLDSQVRFLKGWFKDTLPKASIDKLAVARLDGDLYESTMDAISALYPKISEGGYLIVDDYGAIPACRKAVTDYRASRGIQDMIREIDWTGVYWKKSK